MALKMFASFRGYVLASLLLTTAVITHAIYLKRFFYRSVIYLSQSKLAIMAMGNMGLVTVLLFWRLVQAIFLGPLRFREVERLHIRAREAIIECCFAISVFRNDFDLKFVALVVTLLMLKSLHWLTKDRIEFLEEQPLSPVRTHLRLIGLMTCLLTLDLYLVRRFALLTYNSQEATVYVLFAFEFTVLVIELCSDIIRYIFLVIDTSVDGHWEGKGMFSFYVELLSDLCQLTVYILFFTYVQIYYSFPYHIIRELYVTFHKFQRRCSDFLRYRRVVATMNDLFADATEEELAEGDRTCIICREEMQTAKKLACGHIFHARCLQSWLKRQLTCPTCRATIDVSGNANQAGSARNAPNPPQNNAAPQNQPNINDNANVNNNNGNRLPNNPANAAPPNAQGQGVANFGETGARLFNMANQWFNQVMHEANGGAGARPNAGGAAANGGNQGGAPPQPGVPRQRPGQNHGIGANIFLQGPNALAHMELRARRRGAWPQPYQPYRQNQVPNTMQPNQPHMHQNLPRYQPQGQFVPYGMNPFIPPQHLNHNLQPHVAPTPPAGTAGGPGVPLNTQQNQNAPRQNTPAAQGGMPPEVLVSMNTQGNQAVPPHSNQIPRGSVFQMNVVRGMGQTQGAPASSGQNVTRVPPTDEANQGSASSQATTAAEAGTSVSSRRPSTSGSTNASEQGNSSSDISNLPSPATLPQPAAAPANPQTATGAGQVEAQSIPLERLLAIQEQIEVLRSEVMELVLMATSRPADNVAPELSRQTTSPEPLKKKSSSSRTTNSIEASDTTRAAEAEGTSSENADSAAQEQAQNMADRADGEDENSEAATLRRRRVEFLERNSRR